MKAQYRMRMKKATISGPGFRALRENISNSRKAKKVKE